MQKGYFFPAAGRLRKPAPARHPLRFLAGLLAALCLLASPGFAQEVLWGLTSGFGPEGAGSAFSLRADGSAFAVRKAFTLPPSEPQADLVQGPDGNFYGTTRGGSFGLGTYYRVGPDGTGFAILKTFTEAEAVGALIPGPDGYFYGLGRKAGTGGFIKMRPDGTDLTVVKAFGDAFTAASGLMRAADGVFYGTTAEGGNGSGTIFRINADGTGFAVLKVLSFAEGYGPRGSLVQGTDGFLYGTAPMGGENGEYGSIFRIRPDGSGFAVVKSFAGGPDGGSPQGVVQGADGSFYGAAEGGGSENLGLLYKINGDGSGFTVLKSLSSEEGARSYNKLLVGNDGSLYGTTYEGGNNRTGSGTVFKLSPDGSSYAAIKTFTNADGRNPRGGLVQGSDGNIYGTTEKGGSSGLGTVFKLSPDGSGFTLLNSFGAADGATGYAYGTLVQGSDGNFYGTTEQGGGNSGTVFRLRPDGTYTVLKAFDGTEGAGVGSTLIQGSNGSLYGTTLWGPGGTESGTLFRINPDGSGFTIIRTFTSAGGIFPDQLLAAPDGYFYGTTVNGGVDDYGTLYRVRTDGTDFAVLKLFSFTERVGSLVVGPGGAVYGNLVSGSANNLIRINANGSLTVIRQFTEAGNPGGLRLSSGNTFYCIRGDGAICRINADSSGFALLKTLTDADGTGPTGLVQGSDGTLYGATRYGGNAGYGTLFRLNPDGSGFAVLRSLSAADGVYPYGKLTIERSLSISSFTPAAGPIGTGISLFGQELAGATVVKIGGVSAPFTVVSNTQLAVTVPPGTTGGPIEVTTPAGTVTSPGVFTVTASPAPAIVNFTPKKGPAGTKVTITGTDFTYATAVHFNNVAAAFTYVSATVITATVPAGNASGFVTVTTPGGKATSKQRFTLTPAARLTTEAPMEAVSILYFPNPFSESFTLQVKGKGSDKLPFRICDPYGQVVLQGNDLRATQQIRLGNRMLWGVYYLEVGSGADVKRYKLIRTN